MKCDISKHDNCGEEATHKIIAYDKNNTIIVPLVKNYCKHHADNFMARKDMAIMLSFGQISRIECNEIKE